MSTCRRCGSHAINSGQHGRDKSTPRDLCDVCFWRNQSEQQGLVLATLCDILLGEEAADRSDEALIRAASRAVDLHDSL